MGDLVAGTSDHFAEPLVVLGEAHNYHQALVPTNDFRDHKPVLINRHVARVVALALVYFVHRLTYRNSRSYREWCQRCDTKLRTWLLWPFTWRYQQTARKRCQSSMKELNRIGVVDVTPENHPHGDAASHRSFAKARMDHVAAGMGMDIFEVSPSIHETYLSHHRDFHHIKDLNLSPSTMGVPKSETHVIRMVDVDYFADMYYWMSFGCPLMLYTFLPDTLSGAELNASWAYKADNTVDYIVCGGERFNHAVWNWHNATVAVDLWYGTWVYDIDSYCVGQGTHKRIVCLFPRSFTLGPLAWFLPGERLSRLRVCCDNQTLRLDCVSYKGCRTSSISMGRGGSVELLSEDLDRLIMWQQRKAMDPTSVERALREYDTKASCVGSDAKLLTLWLECHKPTEPTIVTVFESKRMLFQPGQLAPHYQTLHPFVNEDGKTYARMITPCLADTPGVPVDSCNNDHATIDGRIVRVQNVIEPKPVYYTYAAEFIHKLVPESLVGIGQPLDPMEVNQRQNEVRQRARFERWSRTTGTERFQVRAFQKKESYPSINDPRNISTVPTDHTVRLSAFTLAFSDQLLKHSTRAPKWYIPGHTPAEISAKLMDFVRKRSAVAVVDYSRLDGSINRFLRVQVERAAYLRMFNNDVEELTRLLDNEYNAKAVTKNGVRYRPGYSRLSGSPLTTDGNTIICAYVSYCINRRSGMSIDDAYDEIGMIYGDDGVIPCPLNDYHTIVTRGLGLTLKLDIVKQGGAIKYLGRMFLDPWSSDWSCQDPSRCIPRLHLTMTTDANVPINIAANYRADGYLVTDSNTPIIGDWCRYVKRIFPIAGEIDYSKYSAYLDLDRPFAATGSWSQAPEGEDLLMHRVCEDLGVLDCEVHAWQDMLLKHDPNNPKSQWPCIPILTEIKVIAALAGEVRRPGTHKIANVNSPSDSNNSCDSNLSEYTDCDTPKDTASGDDKKRLRVRKSRKTRNSRVTSSRVKTRIGKRGVLAARAQKSAGVSRIRAAGGVDNSPNLIGSSSHPLSAAPSLTSVAGNSNNRTVSDRPLDASNVRSREDRRNTVRPPISDSGGLRAARPGCAQSQFAPPVRHVPNSPRKKTTYGARERQPSSTGSANNQPVSKRQLKSARRAELFRQNRPERTR